MEKLIELIVFSPYLLLQSIKTLNNLIFHCPDQNLTHLCDVVGIRILKILLSLFWEK